MIGRQTFSVRICSCPKRDKEREEEDAEWILRERGESVARTGKRSMTHHKTSKKLKTDITVENNVMNYYFLSFISLVSLVHGVVQSM